MFKVVDKFLFLKYLEGEIELDEYDEDSLDISCYYIIDILKKSVD